jgi:CHASE3 domain sensor protein
VVTPPLAALLAATVSTYLIERADREADGWVERTAQAVDLVQSCLAEVLDGESAVHEYALTGRTERLARMEAASRYFDSDFCRLEDLYRGEPAESGGIQRIRRLYRQETEIWAEMSRAIGVRPHLDPSSSNLFSRCQTILDALRAEFQAMHAEQQRLLVARAAGVSRLRLRKLFAIAGNALLGVAGGLLAILLFTSGVARGVQRLQRNALLLEQRRPMPPRFSGRDELGSLEEALHNASVGLRRSEEERDRFFAISLD